MNVINSLYHVSSWTPKFNNASVTLGSNVLT